MLMDVCIQKVHESTKQKQDFDADSDVDTTIAPHIVSVVHVILWLLYYC